MKSVRTRSVKSVRSMKSVRSTDGSTNERNVLKFDEYLITACKKFSCPCPVVVTKQDEFYKSLKKSESLKYKKTTVVTNSEDANVNQHEKTNEFSGIAPSSEIIDSDTVVIDVVYDNFNQLLEIGMKKVRYIPRLLMQLIGRIVPYYPHLTKMFLKNCHIDAYTIYELSKLLPLTSITDICLDGSLLPQGNYAILLNASCRLNHISLSRCLINDEVCGQIASTLHYLASSEATLMSLNVSSNRITDAGANLLADALRTNRHLRYLNLADNWITDDGAYLLFESLMEFPLTYDEILNQRSCYVDYLKSRQALLVEYLNEWDSKSMDEYSQVSRKSITKKKRNSATSLKSKQSSLRKDTPVQQNVTDEHKAKILADEIMGPFAHPYRNSYISRKDNYSYCIGNMILCYLNLSYNNLTFLSLRKLYRVLIYQAPYKKFDQPGLITVLVEGNIMPDGCYEINQINEIINNNIRLFGGKLYGDFGGRRKSRTGRISILPDRHIINK